jgi:hypothetical protein
LYAGYSKETRVFETGIPAQIKGTERILGSFSISNGVLTDRIKLTFIVLEEIMRYYKKNISLIKNLIAVD